MWHRIADALAEEFTVVAPDLRGYGGSSKPAGEGTTPRTASAKWRWTQSCSWSISARSGASAVSHCVPTTAGPGWGTGCWPTIPAGLRRPCSWISPRRWTCTREPTGTSPRRTFTGFS
ncbi:alpha/beta fold hydrolase [Arthrobacter sp. ATA002]|uniref:alpha/beta fold hydrolase n=1 Tax=Arthrobacter sp. ATA002 TaxID=2991715 RepID=UPI003FA42409